MSDNLTIRRLIEKVSQGDIRIPAFQRGYVWESDQIAFLLDSIYKGFPIGTVILWKTDVRLSTENDLGRYTLPEPQKKYPWNYVLDGQQRITSLFSVFQTELQPNAGDWLDVYFDLHAEESIQESLFVALSDEEVDSKRHFPIKTLFNSVGYRKATADLSNENVVKIDSLQAKFQEYVIQSQTFESDDRNKVAIVFERINRAGTPLDVFELLSAWSWSDDFDLREKFRELQENIEDYGFGDLCEDKDLQLKICAGVIKGKTTPNDILSLKGDEVREKFQTIQSGILGAIDFLKRELDVMHYKMIPFPALLVPLSSFFATEKPEGYNYNAAQKEFIIKWFWRVLFTRRYSSDVNERQSIDINEFKILKRTNEMGLPIRDIRFEFQNSNFSHGNANSKTLILLLSTRHPRSFISGARISADKILKKASKHEFHHIFPQAILKNQGMERKQINCLANICFLTRSDNNTIKDNAPEIYVDFMPLKSRDKLLDEAFCDKEFYQFKYEKFVEERSRYLRSHAFQLMG